MGCCYSCKEEGSNQGAEVNERTRLLVDPVSNDTAVQGLRSDDFISQYPNSLPKKTDEQSALNRILQETATNVIDVAALDSHVLEQHEFHERMKHYQQKLATTKPPMETFEPEYQQPCLLVDVPAPEKVLGGEPLSAANLDLISTIAAKANEALSELKVEHKEDLVVPFRIP